MMDDDNHDDVDNYDVYKRHIVRTVGLPPP